MGTMPPNELLRLWKLEKLPTEMAIGHILQNLVRIEDVQNTFSSTVYEVKADINCLSRPKGMRKKQDRKK